MKKVLILLLLTIATGMFALLSAVDLSEGFEGMSFPPDGWTVINGGDENTWELTNERSHSGSYSAVINYTENAHDDWLISPKLAPTTGNHSFSFWAANYHSVFPDAFNVMLSTTGNEIADFTVTLGGNLVPGTEFQEYSFDLNAYVGQTVYVAIQAISTDMYCLYIDDVSGPALALEAEPSNHVTNISASQINTDAITVSWTGSTGNQLPGKYLVMVKNTHGSYASVVDGTPVTEDSNWSDGNLAKNIAHTVGTNTCTFSGFSLGDVCSVIIYPYTNYGENINFLTTAPVPEISITVTGGCFSEGFEGSIFPPDGWTVINGGDPNTWELSDVIVHSGSYSASILFNGVAHNDWLISHRIAPTASNYTYSFWAVNEDMEYPEVFNVKLSTTGRAMADFTVTLGSNLVPGSAFQFYSYDLSAYVGQNIYVAIQSFSQDMWRLVVDDISGPPLAFETEPSNHVTNIAASQNSSDAIIVSWTGSTGTQLPDKYLIMVKNTGGSYASVADGTPVSDDSNWSDSNLARNVWHAQGNNTCTLSGFSAGDVCSIIIYPYTNLGESINFLTTTPVPEISITINEEGFFEGFEGSSFPPDGWTVINEGDTNTWQRTGGLSHSGSYSASIEFTEDTHNDWLISHRLAPTANYNYTFWAANEHGNYLDAFNVMLSTTGREIADFTVTLGSNIIPGTAFQEYVFDLNAYVGQKIYIAIQAISTDMYCLFIDDVSGPPFASEITPPNPATPVDPVDIATDIILHPTLTWAAGSANSDAYKLYLGSDGNGTAPPTNTINNLNMGANLSYYCTTLLTPNTVYYWQIVPYNAGGNAADCPIWSFTTTGPEAIGGNCLEFDGSGDNVSGTGISIALSTFTIETWVYHNTLPGTVQRYVTLSPEVAVLRYDGTIYGGYRSLHFYIKKANGSGLGVRADSVLVTGEWMHIAGTYDGTNLKLYVNGRLVKSAVSTGAGLYAPSGVYSFSSSVETLDGKLDEVRIWNYVRTETQIRESRHHSLSGTASGLLHYWQFNKSMGTTATDVIGGCDGTLNNMTDEDWIVSTTPLGSGVSYTHAEATGIVTFTGTDLSINYTAHSSASVTVSKLNTYPNLVPTAVNATFYNQYWIVSRYGTGSYNGNISLTLSEDLTDDDQLHPNQIRLYYRSSGSDGNWTALTAAISVNASLNQATFSGISETGQFLVCRDYPATSSQIGTALSFNGSDEYLNVGNSSSFNTGDYITIEAWIKPNSLAGRSGIFSTRRNNQAGSFQLEVGTAGVGTGRVGVSGVGMWFAQTGDNAISTGEWVHIAYTRAGVGPGSGGGIQHIYVNGVSQSITDDNSYSFVSNTSDKVIGSGTLGGQLFNGVMDEVRVWNVARTPDQIRENMYLPLTGTESGLVSYWQFNEGTGLQLMDGISSNNGTLVNMDDNNWMDSIIPFGPGTANSQNQALGFVDFPETGLSMVFENQNTARITATRLDTTPHSTPITDAHFDSQYWVVNAYGASMMLADMTFHVQEDVSPYAEHPEYFQLYTRGSNSEASWYFTSCAISVDVEANTITFDEVGIDGQFVITYDEPLSLAAPQNLQIVRNGSSIHLTWDAVPGANTYYVYASDNPQIYWSAIGIRHPATNWDVPIERQAEFYRIIASEEGIILEKKK